MQDWYYFKTGTYWVYQEKYSGRIDTISVYEDFAGVNYSYWFVFEARSSLDQFRYTYRVDSTFSRSCRNVPDCTCHKVFRTKWRPEDTNWIGENEPFVYPHYVDNYIAQANNYYATSRMIKFLSKMRFEGQSFHDVVQWDVNLDDSEGDAHTSYIVARNVGIIEKINYDLNEDWRLIDYFVIQ
jgi:hypothetical protein